MRRLGTLVTVIMAIIWLPATLRCEIAALPGFEVFSCEKACDGLGGRTCSDGCATLERGLFKVSSDDPKAPALVAVLLCKCMICPATKFSPTADDADAELVWFRTGDPDEYRRTWHFAQRAAPPSRAPAV